MYFHNRVLTYFLCVPSVFLYFCSITHLNGKLFISCMLYILYPSVIVFIVFIVNKQTTSIPRTFEKLATPLTIITIGLCQVMSHSRESKCILGVAAICKVSKPRCSVVGELSVSFALKWYVLVVLKSAIVNYMIEKVKNSPRRKIF